MKELVRSSNPMTHDKLELLVSELLKQAKSLGADAAEVSISTSTGFNTSVRKGEIDTLEYNHDNGLSLVVYFGESKGAASTTDLSLDALSTSLKKACDIAKYTQADPFSGLADPTLMATDYPDLDLCHPWGLTADEGVEMAKACEAIGLAYDRHITNSDGASLSTTQSLHVYGNSHGFLGAYSTTAHDLNCVLVAEQAGNMQRDYSYTVARDPADLMSINAVAEDAAKRTVSRLGARKIKRGQVPVLFSPEMARGLVSCFLRGIRGGNLYRKASFLLDHLDKPVFADHIHIYEQPHVLKGLGSAPFDREGVTTTAHDLVADGVLKSYILGSYSARKLGMQTTGNAGGVHNVFVKPGKEDFKGLLKKMDTGLLVTEMMGDGVNILTGDYSRGASGFWVEGGEIQYPVEEITIAGKLQDMFMNLVAVGTDIDKRSHIQTGSILLESMMVAGE